MKCINCGKRITDNSKYCIHCGYDNSQNITVSTSRKKNRKIFLIPVILFLTVLLSLLFMFVFHRDYLNKIINNNRIIPFGDSMHYESYVKTRYNIKGQMTEQLFYDVDKNPLHKFTYEYDKNNRLIRSDLVDADGNLIYYSIHEYDRKGNNNRVLYYNPNDELYITADNIFDANGNMIESHESPVNNNYHTIKYYDNGIITEEIVTNYNENHEIESEIHYNADYQIVKEIRYSTNGSIIQYYTYEYDDDGKKIKRYEYDEDEKLYGYEEYEYYGDDTQPTITSCYDADGTFKRRYQFEYLDAVKIKEMTIYDANNQITSRYVGEYNEFNKHIKTTRYNASNQIESYYVFEYKDGDESDYLSKVTHYDPNGNITGISDYSDRQITDIFPY